MKLIDNQVSPWDIISSKRSISADGNSDQELQEDDNSPIEGFNSSSNNFEEYTYDERN